MICTPWCTAVGSRCCWTPLNSFAEKGQIKSTESDCQLVDYRIERAYTDDRVPAYDELMRSQIDGSRIVGRNWRGDAVSDPRSFGTLSVTHAIGARVSES